MGSDHRFDFDSVSESRVGSRRDIVLDFSHSEGDLIDVSTIDADVMASGNQRFRFIGTEAFADYMAAYPGIRGLIRIAADGTVEGNVNRTPAVDVQISMSIGGPELLRENFIL